MSNLTPSETDINVNIFIATHQEDILTLVAGLLDYGYDIGQIARMTGYKPQMVERIKISNDLLDAREQQAERKPQP